MIRRVLLAGILAGLCAGAVGFTVQALKVTPLIHKAEVFEATAKARATLSGKPAGTVTLAAGRRPLFDAGLTLAASLLTGAGFGLLLAGAIAFSGRDPTMIEGLLWGFAGFAVFSLAPALVVPPHLPGMAEADLAARQFWWLGAAGATAAGLGLFAGCRRWPARTMGLALLAIPFILTGPETGPGAGAELPPALVSAFVAASIAAAAVFWASLGIVLSLVFARISAAAAATGDDEANRP